jgi:mannose-1-phosphate guanylyltransferase
MIVLPTDHYIRHEVRQLASFKEGISRALRGEYSYIVFGLTPTFPATGFGYIKLKGRAPDSGKTFRVDRFVEKPDLATARKYLKSGAYLWNSGVFVFRVDALMDALKRLRPGIFRRAMDPKKALRRYREMPDISIDYAIMEKVKGIGCVRGSYGWNDVGSFEALGKALRREGRRFVSHDGKIVRIL